GIAAALTVGAAVMLFTTFASAAPGGRAQHVRWDIISTTGVPPTPINSGGRASATAPGGDTITLTGSGHFVAPASGGGSSAAIGGRPACSILPAPPQRSGLESGVHETKGRRDGSWNPDGSARVHEADLRRRHREDVWARRPDSGRRGAGGVDRPQRRPG